MKIITKVAMKMMTTGWKSCYLGNDGHYNPAERLRDMASPMLDRGIKLFYSSDINELEL